MRSDGVDLGSEADLCREEITWGYQVLTGSAWHCSLAKRGVMLLYSQVGLVGDQSAGDITREGSFQPLAQE